MIHTHQLNHGKISQRFYFGIYSDCNKMFIVSWHLTKEQQHKNTYLVLFFLFTTHVYIESILLFWHFKTQASEASSHKAFFFSLSLSLCSLGELLCLFSTPALSTYQTEPLHTHKSYSALSMIHTQQSTT